MVTHFNFMGSHYCSVVKYSIATVKGLLELLLQEAGGKKKRNRKTRLRLSEKEYYQFVFLHHRREFPGLVNYGCL